MVVQKGKEATKGQKQIDRENSASMTYYTYITLGGLAVSWLSAIYFNYLLPLFGLCVHATVIWMLKLMVKSGLDINQSSGTGEDLKDILLVTAMIEVGSLFSLHFWWFWLIIPIIAFYRLWVGYIAPWIFQEAPEVDEKKQKKLDRRMRRAQNFR